MTDEGELRYQFDQIRSVMDEYEIGDPDKALHDRLIQWIAQVGSVALTVRTERDEMRAKLRYLRAAAEVFPHCNTDRATHTQIGLPDAEDVWCLGCTIGSTVEYFDREMWDEADAEQWMREYEAAEAARYDAEETP
jgi:hypothetical protein